MTVLDNVMTGRLNKMNSGLLAQAIWRGKAEQEEIENREKAEKIIDFLEIQHIRKTPVARLPYGLKKRVELARTLAGEPKVLLLDEWLAGLNPTELEAGIELIHNLRNEGRTIVMVEHVMDAIRSLCDRCVVMSSGVKIVEGTTDEVLSDQEVIRAYLGDDDA